MFSANYWYGYIIRALHNYPDGLSESIQGCIAKGAISKTIEEFKSLQDGEDKIKLENMVNIKQTHTMDGAAMVLHISRRTAQRWNRAFIYSVAEKMGFF